MLEDNQGAARTPSPATPEEVTHLEQQKGISLPPELKALYRLSNCPSLFGGDFQLYPLDGTESSVARFTASFRRFRWIVPEELTIIGVNGNGDPFGLWQQAPLRGAVPIVQTGVWEDPLAPLASSIVPFLLGETAVFAHVSIDEPWRRHRVLQCIGLPRELSPHDPDDYDEWAIYQWAEPHFLRKRAPQGYPVSYTPDGLRSFLSQPRAQKLVIAIDGS